MNEPHNVVVAARKGLGDANPTRASDGPKPELENFAYVALVTWIGGYVRGRVSDAALTIARKITKPQTLSVTDQKKLEVLSRNEGPDFEAQLLRGISTEVLTANQNQQCGAGARLAAAATARACGAEFIAALEVELARLGTASAIARYIKSPTPPIKRVIWRGLTGAKVSHFIVEHVDGTFGMLANVRKRWVWSAGSADDIVALLSEAQFAPAVAALMGQATPASAGLVFSSRTAEVGNALTGLAFDQQGRIWLSSAKGVGRWEREQPHLFDTTVKRISGLSTGGTSAATVGTSLLHWASDGQVTEVAESADGAFVLANDSVAWWAESKLVIANEKGPTLAVKQVAERGAQLAVLTADSLSLISKRKVVERWAIEADAFVIAPDGKRAATWSTKGTSNTVTIIDFEAAKPLATLQLDRANIVRVVFSGDGVLVGYHEGRRVAFFDSLSQSKPTKVLDAGKVMHGKAATLRPLQRGIALGFNPWPKAEVFLFDADARALAPSLSIGRSFVGGSLRLDEHGDSVVLAYTHRDRTVLLQLSLRNSKHVAKNNMPHRAV